MEKEVYIINEINVTRILLNPLDVTEAMVVTSTGPQTFQKAQGETVELGCAYTAGPQDTGELDIEWYNVSPDMTQKDKLVGELVRKERKKQSGRLGKLQVCVRTTCKSGGYLFYLWALLENLLLGSILTQPNLCISDLIICRKPDALLRRPGRLQKAQVHKGSQVGRRFHLSL